MQSLFKNDPMSSVSYNSRDALNDLELIVNNIM